MSTLPPAFFDAMYADGTDPWGFASRQYEQRKYAITVASLPRPRYRRAFEPGCSIGVLTAMLAARCDEIVAVDTSDAAVATASASLRGPGVDLRTMVVPQEWPEGAFDLVVLSEIGYYFSPVDLGRLIDESVASLEAGGHLVAVHWKPQVDEYPGHGAAVHATIAADPRLVALAHYEEALFVLDLFGADAAAALPDPDSGEQPLLR